MTNNNYEDDIFSDELVDLDKDAFNFDAEAEQLAQKLKRGKAPFVAAICGEWGAGKSSFLRFLHQKLKDENNIVIYFNVWRASIHQSPEIAFLYALKTQLEKSKILNKKAKKIKNTFNAVISSAIDVFSESPKIWGSLFKTYKKTKNQIKGEIETTIKSEEKLLTSFNNLCSLIPEGINVYIFIDELDRCSPEFSVKIIESLKKFFYGKDVLDEDILGRQEEKRKSIIIKIFKLIYRYIIVDVITSLFYSTNKKPAIRKTNLTKTIPFKYILAIDESFITKSFASHYLLAESEASKYLSKFIQYSYYLKGYDWSKLIKNVISTKEDVDKNFWTEQNIIDINYLLIKSFRVYNPRTVKKILSRIISYQGVLKITFEERRAYLEKTFNISEKEIHIKAFIFKESILRATNIFWLIDACIKELFPSEIKWYLDNNVFEKLPSTSITIDIAQESAKNNWPRYFFISNYSIPTFELSLENGEIRKKLDSMAFAINESIQHVKAICSGLKINNYSFPNDNIIKLLVHLMKNEWDLINYTLFL